MKIFLITGMFFLALNVLAQEKAGMRFKGNQSERCEYKAQYANKDDINKDPLHQRIAIYFEDRPVAALDFNLDKYRTDSNLNIQIIEFYDNNAYPEMERNIHFHKIDSLKFVNNYKINDPNISVQDKPELLFTAYMDAGDSLHIKLYKYKSVHDSTDYEFFKIEDDAPELNAHINWIKEYYRHLQENTELVKRRTWEFYSYMENEDKRLKNAQESQINIEKLQNQEATIREEAAIKDIFKVSVTNEIKFQLAINESQPNSSVISSFDFVVDTLGVVKDGDKLKAKFRARDNSTMIESLINANILNMLKRKAFPTSTRMVSGSTMYESFVSSCEKFCKDSELEINKFEPYLQSVNKSMGSYEKVTIPVQVHYNFDLPLSLEDSSYLWTYDDKDQLSSNASGAIISENRKEQFLQKRVNFKPGLYRVKIAKGNLDNSGFLDSVYKVTINHRYFTMFGLSYTTFVTPSNALFHSPSNGIDLFYIYHHFGLFAGTLLSDTAMISYANRNGKIFTNGAYGEAGIYLAAFNYLYLRAGVATIQNNGYAPILGISLVFPWVQIECGYNYLFNSMYVNFGLNIKINK